MKPINFKSHNKVYAKDQPEYGQLPVYEKDGVVISCCYLTWKERIKLLFTGKIWMHVYSFGQPLQPQMLDVDRPTMESSEG